MFSKNSIPLYVIDIPTEMAIRWNVGKRTGRQMARIQCINGVLLQKVRQHSRNDSEVKSDYKNVLQLFCKINSFVI